LLKFDAYKLHVFEDLSLLSWVAQEIGRVVGRHKAGITEWVNASSEINQRLILLKQSLAGEQTEPDNDGGLE
jgi:hypothetical protein